MKRIVHIGHDFLVNLRGWRARRRLQSETAINLVDTMLELRRRVDELERDLDELRGDSRRVAEIRIQVEDFLAEHV